MNLKVRQNTEFILVLRPDEAMWLKTMTQNFMGAEPEGDAEKRIRSQMFYELPSVDELRTAIRNQEV